MTKIINPGQRSLYYIAIIALLLTTPHLQAVKQLKNAKIIKKIHGIPRFFHKLKNSTYMENFRSTKTFSDTSPINGNKNNKLNYQQLIIRNNKQRCRRACEFTVEYSKIDGKITRIWSDNIPMKGKIFYDLKAIITK